MAVPELCWLFQRHGCSRVSVPAQWLFQSQTCDCSRVTHRVRCSGVSMCECSSVILRARRVVVLASLFQRCLCRCSDVIVPASSASLFWRDVRTYYLMTAGAVHHAQVLSGG